MATAVMRRLRSIQKKVLWIPPHVRLPAARKPSTSFVLMRKVNPHFLTWPGNVSTSNANAGLLLRIIGTSRSPMALRAISFTVSCLSICTPSSVPPASSMRVKAR